MPLRKLVLENYRCFRDRQEIELAPVTVVLGKNNSGKSVLTRAPLVIATGFGTTNTAPLDLDRLDPQPVDSYTDLIFEQNPHRSFHLGFEADHPTPLTLGATIQYVSEYRTAFVSELTLVSGGREVTLTWEPALSAEDEPPRYATGLPDGTTEVSHVSFEGLLPVSWDIHERLSLAQWRDGFVPIRYLSAYRDRPDRQHRLPLGAPPPVGERGQGIAGILADDALRADGALLDRVNRHLQLITPGWRIEEQQVGPLWSTVLTRDGSRVAVNLADAGTGIAQVLPILVQCALDELGARRRPPTLQIIEEPEMHLHPAAHAELADLYLHTAQHTPTRFLIETHSETLLLRLRRRIAQGDAAPDVVAVYVVEQERGVSTVRRVGIDDLGNLDESWPEGYFSQDYEEVRLLASAQLRRSGYAS